MQAFSPFNLADAPAASVHREGPALRRHLCRIAHALKLDEPALHWQFVSHIDAAKSYWDAHGGCFKDAWAHACLHSADARPTKTLEKVILCWLVTSCSSSGVEQNFSKGAFGFQDRQLASDMQHERSTHRLLLYDGPVLSLVTGAQRVWRHGGTALASATRVAL